LAELTLYKINALPQDYQKLINTVTDIRKAYALTQQKAAKGPEMFRDRLLEMTNEEWEACKKLTRQALIDVQSTGIVAGLPDDMLQKRLTNLSNLPTNEEHRAMSISLLSATVKPNMTLDYVGTTERVLKASESVQAQRISLKAGDLIVKGGEKIKAGQSQWIDLDGRNYSNLLWHIWLCQSAMAIFTQSKITY
jgi:membrane-associated HD superfamily phosphohydrolase